MSRKQSRARRLAAAEQLRPQASIQGPGQVIGEATSTQFANPAYDAAGLDRQETANWWPTQSSADAITLGAKDLSLARIRDALRNDPSARAALDRLVDHLVGPGLRLSAKPDGVALGIEDTKVLRKFARQLQTEWRLFADDPRRTCDVQRKLSMNGIFRLLARTWITAGECTYANSWRDPKAGESYRYSTCVMVIDPDRLSNPNGEYETLTLRGGVEMDSFGAPIAYHVRNAHIGDWWAAEQAWTWTRVPRATSWGRPIFVHGFEAEREGQTRGISPFVSLISRLRMISKHGDAELASAVANALWAAVVTSDLPGTDIADRMSPQAVMWADKPQLYTEHLVSHFTKFPLRVGGVRVPVLPPGTELKMNNAPRQTASFASFQTAFLQSIASALGLSYEQLSMDWSRTNYSSARAALNEVWRTVTRLKNVFVEQVVMPIYYAVVEEAIDKGYIEIPKSAKPLGIEALGIPANDNLAIFRAMPGAILRARWIGPGRGFIDPVKEAEAAALRMEAMTSTLERECAEQGEDYEEVLDQIAVEEQDLKDRGLTRLSLVAAVQSKSYPKPDSVDADGPQGPGGEEKTEGKDAA